MGRVASRRLLGSALRHQRSPSAAFANGRLVSNPVYGVTQFAGAVIQMPHPRETACDTRRVDSPESSARHRGRNQFRWLLPGESVVAVWGMNRVSKVQGNSRDLVAGAYTVLAALWGSL